MRLPVHAYVRAYEFIHISLFFSFVKTHTHSEFSTNMCVRTIDSIALVLVDGLQEYEASGRILRLSAMIHTGAGGAVWTAR